MNAPDSSPEYMKLPEYLKLPKYIGSVEPQTLILIAKDSMGRTSSETPALRAGYGSIAASALIEAAITFDNLDHNYDDKLIDLLDHADEQLTIARLAEEELLGSGYKQPDDFIDLLHLETHSDFMNVYKDIVCGEVTEMTSLEVIESLNRRIRSLSKRRSTRRANKNAAGIKAELIALREVWIEYTKGNGRIAIPSTNRGGDGTYNPGQTHDIVYLDESDDGFRVSDYGEIKSSRAWRRRSLDITGRYDSEVTSVNTKKSSVTRRLGSVVSVNTIKK